jgi:hypothetical protein
MEIKLYNVDSTVEEYRGCKNVNFRWFVHDRMEPAADVPLHEAIEGFDPADEHNIYPIGALAELFTLEEAEMLRDYLKAEYGDEPTITEVDLPILPNRAGVGFIAVGGGQDFYMLDKTPGYSLPFQVWGYYDLRPHWDADLPGWEMHEEPEEERE